MDSSSTLADSDFNDAPTGSGPVTEFGFDFPRAIGGVQWLRCSVWYNNPHYSPGAPGVIAKLRYSCVGNTDARLYAFRTIYRYRPSEAGPYEPKAEIGDYTFVGPGSTGTLYVPDESQPGLNCNLQYWYFAKAYVSLVGISGGSNSGNVRSTTEHPQRCP